MGKFIRSNSSSRSWRRRLAQVANGSFPAVRPCSLRSFFLRLLTFVHRQRLQLIHDPRGHLHQPMPVPEQLPQITILQLGTHMLGKLFSSGSFRSSWASWRSVFCFTTSYALNLRSIPDPDLDTPVRPVTVQPACVASGFHAHRKLIRRRCRSRWNFSGSPSLSFWGLRPAKPYEN
jgi:hypothetical protein